MIAYAQPNPSPWDALGDPTRRAIFRRIADAPCAVGEIARTLPISRPAVSQHLRILKDAGLVSDRAEGTRRIYTVDVGGLAKLRADLDAFWTGALGAFKAAAERDVDAHDQDTNDKETDEQEKS
ncbi:MAG: transcriptional regulator, ArsR family [Labilithrix sp.]|nr:transcriptional regulator, ArsR family [Labilithrix sp.]